MITHGHGIEMVVAIPHTVLHFSCTNLISSVRGIKMTLGTNTLQLFTDLNRSWNSFLIEKWEIQKKLKNIRLPERLSQQVNLKHFSEVEINWDNLKQFRIHLQKSKPAQNNQKLADWNTHLEEGILTLNWESQLDAAASCTWLIPAKLSPPTTVTPLG